MITGFECYRKYLALKLHFYSDRYHYTQYNGQTKLNTGKFETRNDVHLFKKLEKKYGTEEDLEDFLVSNILYKYGEFYIENTYDERCEFIYNDYVKVKHAFTHYFGEEIKSLKIYCKKHNIKNMYKVSGDNYPELLSLLQQNMIRIQTVFALNKIRPFLSYWHEKIRDGIIWPEIERKILKYEPFCANIDRSTLIRKYNNIMIM